MPCQLRARALLRHNSHYSPGSQPLRSLLASYNAPLCLIGLRVLPPDGRFCSPAFKCAGSLWLASTASRLRLARLWVF